MDSSFHIMGITDPQSRLENLENYRARLWFPTAKEVWAKESGIFEKMFEDYNQGIRFMMAITYLFDVAASCKIRQYVTLKDKNKLRVLPSGLGVRFLNAILPLDNKWSELAITPSLQEEALRHEIGVVASPRGKRI